MADIKEIRLDGEEIRLIKAALAGVAGLQVIGSAKPENLEMYRKLMNLKDSIELQENDWTLQN